MNITHKNISIANDSFRQYIEKHNNLPKGNSKKFNFIMELHGITFT